MIDAAPRRRLHATLRHRGTALLMSTVLAALLATPAIAASAPATRSTAATAGTTATTTTTSTASTMASYLLSWINRDRVASGLRPLRSWPAMASVANRRSARMASSLTLSHAAAGGDAGAALKAAGLQWYSYGEIIGTSSYTWGYAAAANLYSMWKASRLHHAIIFSSTFNYIGIGIARAANGSTWSSILFTESVDHTRPAARNGSLTASGATIRFAWWGYDPLLQTHTAGLRSFDVLYRVDWGTWHLLRNDTTSRWLTLYGRARHHYYSFRVQAADRRGNLSAWTPVKRIWLP